MSKNPQMTVPQSESKGFFTYEPPTQSASCYFPMVARSESGSSRGSTTSVFAWVYHTSPGGAARCLRTCLRKV